MSSVTFSKKVVERILKGARFTLGAKPVTAVNKLVSNVTNLKKTHIFAKAYKIV